MPCDCIRAYRSERQTDYNAEHGITPQTVKRAAQESLHMFRAARELEAEMAGAAGKLEYERAALLRDQIRELKRQAGISDASTQLPQRKATYGGGKRRRKGRAPVQ